eukprot:scaffold425_cov365-Pavlova_lutheri.AAC.1
MPSWVLLGSNECSRRSRSNTDVKLFFHLDWILRDLLPSLCLPELDTIDVSELSGSRTGKSAHARQCGCMRSPHPRQLDQRVRPREDFCDWVNRDFGATR